MMYFIVPGIIICVLFLLMVPFKTDKSRAFLLNLIPFPVFVTFIVWLQILMINHIDDTGFMVILSFVMYAVSALIFVFLSCHVIDNPNLGTLIIKEYKKSKEIPLMTPEQINQEAKIRLKMERLKDTLTFSERELEAKKYVESKK